MTTPNGSSSPCTRALCTAAPPTAGCTHRRPRREPCCGSEEHAHAATTISTSADTRPATGCTSTPSIRYRDRGRTRRSGPTTSRGRRIRIRHGCAGLAGRAVRPLPCSHAGRELQITHRLPVQPTSCVQRLRGVPHPGDRVRGPGEPQRMGAVAAHGWLLPARRNLALRGVLTRMVTATRSLRIPFRATALRTGRATPATARLF